MEGTIYWARFRGARGAPPGLRKALEAELSSRELKFTVKTLDARPFSGRGAPSECAETAREEAKPYLKGDASAVVYGAKFDRRFYVYWITEGGGYGHSEVEGTSSDAQEKQAPEVAQKIVAAVVGESDDASPPTGAHPNLKPRRLMIEACPLRKDLVHHLERAPRSVRSALAAPLDLKDAPSVLVETYVTKPANKIGPALVRAFNRLRSGSEAERSGLRLFVEHLVVVRLRTATPPVEVWISEGAGETADILSVPGPASYAIAETLVAALHGRPARLTWVNGALDSPHRLNFRPTQMSGETAARSVDEAAARQGLSDIFRDEVIRPWMGDDLRGGDHSPEFFQDTWELMRAEDEHYYVVFTKDYGADFAEDYRRALKVFKCPPPAVLQEQVPEPIAEVEELLAYLSNNLRALRELFAESLSP